MRMTSKKLSLIAAAFGSTEKEHIKYFTVGKIPRDDYDCCEHCEEYYPFVREIYLEDAGRSFMLCTMCDDLEVEKDCMNGQKLK
jgi:hypothetical protein